MNKLIVIRGTSPSGPVTRAYLNVDEQQALVQFLQHFIYVSSDVIEFDHELQVDTPEQYLRFKAVEPKQHSAEITPLGFPWRNRLRRLAR